MFGAEPHPNYNRILLSPVLAGEQTIKDIVLNDWDWYRDNGINLVTGKEDHRHPPHTTGIDDRRR